MKIVSINSELTESPNNVAFNLDQDPTAFEVDKVTAEKFYGSLTFKFESRCLIVTTTPDETPLKAETVDEINTKLSSVHQQEAQLIQRHKDMINHVSELTGLPIG